MKAVVTPEEMRIVDATAADRIDQLIERAGAAAARAALAMLGGPYGRHVVVLAGSGNNGADGRVAAGHLHRRGVHVRIVAVASGALCQGRRGCGVWLPLFVCTLPPCSEVSSHATQ